MRTYLLAATAVVALGGVAAVNLFSPADAQPVPPPVAGDAMPGGWHHGPHPGWMGAWHHRRPEHLRTFALLYHSGDRHLTPADVQKIAEAFLLWNGNHTWKVTDVKAGADNAVAFTIAAPDGTAIAQFTMDSKTGRVTRTG